MDVSIFAPDWSMGDITGYLSSERDMILGSESRGNNAICIRAQVPQENMSGFSNQFKSMTSGDGEYSMVFSHYDAVLDTIQKKLSEKQSEKPVSNI